MWTLLTAEQNSNFQEWHKKNSMIWFLQLNWTFFDSQSIPSYFNPVSCCSWNSLCLERMVIFFLPSFLPNSFLPPFFPPSLPPSLSSFLPSFFHCSHLKNTIRDFPGGAVVKNRALVWENPTRCGATKPACHNYWTCALEPMSHSYWARMPQLLKPVHLEPMLCNKGSHRNEKPAHHNEE